MRTFTFMLARDDYGEFIKRPNFVISKSIFIYTQLSLDGGGSPAFYWDPGGTYLMLDNWTQRELDAFASFHAVAAVSSLELTDEEASAIIALADSRTVRSTAAKPIPS